MSVRSFRVVSALLLSLVACKGSKPAPSDQPVRVAAAADLSVAFPEVARAFTAKTGTKVSFSFGASGLLSKQVSEGAPFDLFAAANASYVDEAVKSGQCLGDTKKNYAQGHLALWSKDSTKLPKSIEELSDPKYTKISIANPEHAPYGKAAKQAMQKAGVWDAAKKRIVMGENVQQAMQFAQTGNAEVAVVALSLALTAGGPYLALDPALHEPLDQAMVVCRGGTAGAATGGGGAVPPDAKAFEDFVGGGEGRAIMRKYGFLLPGEPIPSK